MTIRRLGIGIAAVVWMVAAHAPAPVAAIQRALPPGEGRETVITICGDCHGPELVGSQRRSKVEWETMIEDMAARNAVATDEEKKVILTYTLHNFGRVNINTATAEDVAQIVQLKPAEAAAIVDYRQKSGEFKTLDDLRKVPGVDFTGIQERKDRIGFTGP